jgi:hypothetical protein
VDTLFVWSKSYEVFIDHKSLKYIFTHQALNLRQRRWIEFLEEYKFSINYHPGKANVVVHAFSQKVRMARLRAQDLKPMEKVLSLDVEVGKEKIFFFFEKLECGTGSEKRDCGIMVE